VLGQLAKHLTQGTDSTVAFDMLLPIRAKGTLPPLFCLHPGAGLCWPYTSLLRHTSEEQPVYGIQARGFSDQQSLPQTLEEVISDSVTHIRSVQSSGPYRLLGWSFGGVLAHMVATRLQSQGEQVERLFLFDSHPTAAQLAERNLHSRRFDDVWRELAIGTNLSIPSDASGQSLNAQTIASLAQEQLHILGSFSLQQLEQLAAVMANNSRLLRTAQLDTFKGDMTLFIAKGETLNGGRAHIDPEAWRPFCRGSIRTIAIDAEHHQMFSPAALRQLNGSLQDLGE
jgi:thioesterase domain-containing protein